MEPLNLPLGIKVGIDLVWMKRYEKFVDDEAFLRKILTMNERMIYNTLKLGKHKLEFICGRMACKEAYSKAKGTGIGKVDFLDFEVLKGQQGEPYALNAEVSLSHDGEYVVAVVMVHG